MQFDKTIMVAIEKDQAIASYDTLIKITNIGGYQYITIKPKNLSLKICYTQNNRKK